MNLGGNNIYIAFNNKLFSDINIIINKYKLWLKCLYNKNKQQKTAKPLKLSH